MFDTGWHREMSPEGVYDAAAQRRSLGSRLLYLVNQGQVGPGQSVTEQLRSLQVSPTDLDYVLLSHLDCDHANGLRQVAQAKRILVSKEELAATRQVSLSNRIRYRSCWWAGVDLQTFTWNGTEGPVGHSCDLLGDDSVVLVHIPGHSEGLCALKLSNPEGRYVLLYSDGGYAKRSWQELIVSGVAVDRRLQHRSLEWIARMSRSPDCVESLASHDPDLNPGVLEF